MSIISNFNGNIVTEGGVLNNQSVFFACGAFNTHYAVLTAFLKLNKFLTEKN